MSDRTKENDGGEVDGDPNAVKESKIRKMTRLAIEFQAVNLSQGESLHLFSKEPGGESLISFKIVFAVICGTIAASRSHHQMICSRIASLFERRFSQRISSVVDEASIGAWCFVGSPIRK